MIVLDSFLSLDGQNLLSFDLSYYHTCVGGFIMFHIDLRPILRSFVFMFRRSSSDRFMLLFELR